MLPSPETWLLVLKTVAGLMFGWIALRVIATVADLVGRSRDMRTTRFVLSRVSETERERILKELENQ
jgi:hypothetical protein